MIPVDRQSAISLRLQETIGFVEEVGSMLYTIAALPVGHDTDYLLDMLIAYPMSDNRHIAATIILEELSLSKN